MVEEAQHLLNDLKNRCSAQKPLYEIEMIYAALEGAVSDLKVLVDVNNKMEHIDDEGTRSALLVCYKMPKACFYKEAALARSYTSKT